MKKRIQVNVDEKLFRDFKKKSAEEGMFMNEILEKLIKEYLEKK